MITPNIQIIDEPVREQLPRANFTSKKRIMRPGRKPSGKCCSKDCVRLRAKGSAYCKECKNMHKRKYDQGRQEYYRAMDFMLNKLRLRHPDIYQSLIEDYKEEVSK